VTVLQIDYDLRAPGRDYSGFYRAIKSFGTWCHALDSTWFIVTTRPPSEVAEYLHRQLDRNDGLLVDTARAPAAWYGLSTEVSDWLRAQLN
jgi:hypothetical protein